MSIETLDRIDRHILQLLQKNAQINNQNLADAVGLSPTPCARRVKRLHDDGFIQKQVALVDANKLNLNLSAYLSISMDRHTPERFEAFEAAIADYPEVLECAIVTGQSADYMLKVVVKDMQHYEQFLLGKLTRIAGVTGVHTSFVLREITKTTALPVNP